MKIYRIFYFRVFNPLSIQHTLYWLLIFMKKIFIISLLLVAMGAKAQTADEKIKSLAEKYKKIDQFSADVSYSTVNERMGFSNTQTGNITVDGERYVLTFGSTEKWLSDGKTEYIGTKEDDHSQILYFCPGQNEEAIVNFTMLLTFYASNHTAEFDGEHIKIKPLGEAAYVVAMLELSGDEIKAVTFEDDFGTVYRYELSGFSTDISGASFTINESEYKEKIDERAGCN